MAAPVARVVLRGECRAGEVFDRSGRALSVRTAAGRMRSAHHRYAARLPRARRLWRDAGQRRLASCDARSSPTAGCCWPGAPPACWRCIPARAIGPTCRTCRHPRKCAAAARPRSATGGRWGASWCVARPATTSFPSSIPPRASRSSTSPARGPSTPPTLHSILLYRGITQLVVTGVTTEVCVNSTVREANDRGYDCFVPEDCVGSYFPEFQDIGLKMIKAQGGIFGWVGTSADIVAAIGGG